jgi:adenylate cyclase
MVQEGFKRKLTAILSADAVGYSRLMAEDETATVKTIASYREIIASLVKQHRGRVVDSPGDNLLAEFSSVVDAVQSAVAVQNEIQTRNAELPDNRRMEFRIGINLGDVIDEDGRIYGDGVNISARLEALADPGGICVSKTAFDQIETKLPLGYEYLGEQSVKNIPKPVGAYRVLMKPEAAGKVIGEKRFLGRYSRKTAMAAIIILVIVAGALFSWNIYLQQSKKVEPASVEKMAFKLPDKPSIAVLPFVNKSGDPKQEYFSDGITETIITALTQIQNMFVIARSSTNTYKGKDVEIKQVAEELGVRYVLEGSVQKTEDRVRISAQLIDAITGKYLWAERWDRELEDIFALQDEITKKIITSLDVTLLKGVDARRWARSTDNLEAYLKYLEGTKLHQRNTKDYNLRGRKMLEEAIALDPNYIGAYCQLGVIHFVDAAYGWAESRDNSLKTAEELARKALSLDDALPGGLNLLGAVYGSRGDIKKAVALMRKAVALEPNSANLHAWLGAHLIDVEGKAEEAIEEFEIARRLNPIPPDWIMNYSAVAYRVNGEYEKAIEILQTVIKRNPDAWLSHFELAACYGLLGREEEAGAAAVEVLRIRPDFTIEKLSGHSYGDKANKERTIGVLRKAGLKLN